MTNMTNNGDHNLKFYPENAITTVKELDKAWNERRGVFNIYRDKEMPEATLPKKIESKSKEHALYLTYVSSLNYRTSSDLLFERMRGLYDAQPYMFKPSYVRKINESETKEFTDQIRHFENTAPGRWQYNSEMMKRWDDDPRNILKVANYKCHNDVPAIVAQNEVRLLKGFQYKQSSLLLYWFYKYGIGDMGEIDITDLNIPVDLHVKRISISRDIVTFDGQINEHRLEKFLREEYVKLFKENRDLDSFRFQEQLWILGSQGCTEQEVCRSRCAFDTECKKTMLQQKISYMYRKKYNKINGIIEIIDKPPAYGTLDNWGFDCGKLRPKKTKSRKKSNIETRIV